MSSFKVGDRIRYYGAFNELIEESLATVERIQANGLLNIKVDCSADEAGPAHTTAHPKQCRKLKPVEYIWVPKKWESSDIEEITKSGNEYLSEEPCESKQPLFQRYRKVNNK